MVLFDRFCKQKEKFCSAQRKNELSVFTTRLFCLQNLSNANVNYNNKAQIQSLKLVFDSRKTYLWMSLFYVESHTRFRPPFYILMGYYSSISNEVLVRGMKFLDYPRPPLFEGGEAKTLFMSKTTLYYHNYMG